MVNSGIIGGELASCTKRHAMRTLNSKFHHPCIQHAIFSAHRDAENHHARARYRNPRPHQHHVIAWEEDTPESRLEAANPI